ncbi:hypothetical protein OG981_50475 [Streptomyces mirabilis]|uniref:hypothetical protein n=1 Tax=Streptomyces mirabilis TaxID=68239 RepID=UPI000A8EEEE6|nr:hypothetical protein [Streptomyces mirabilis]
MSNAQIAAALGLTEGNMKSCVNRILTRSYMERRVTKGHTRREAIRYLNRCVHAIPTRPSSQAGGISWSQHHRLTFIGASVCFFSVLMRAVRS